MPGRRQMMAGMAAFALTALPARSALIQSRFEGIGQRFLWVKQAGRWEELQTAFRDAEGRLIEDGLRYLSWIFRDWKDHDTGIWMDYRLFDLLAAIQTEATIEADFPVRITLTSGYRTARRNRRIEGAAFNSQHIRGRAADISLTGIPHAMTARIADRLGAHGLGRYAHFTHVDVGDPGRRW